MIRFACLQVVTDAILQLFRVKNNLLSANLNVQ